MISRKEKYKSDKPAVLVTLDKYINSFTTFWNNHSGWLIIGAIIGTFLAIPGWIFIFLE